MSIVAGASLKIFYVDAQWPGSQHDSRIFRDSKLYKKLDDKNTRPHPDFLIVADSAYQVHQLLSYIVIIADFPANIRS